ITNSHRPILLLRPAAAAHMVPAVAFIVPIALLVLIQPPPAGAADWTFTPTLRLREAYSDNVFLAPAPLAQGDFINEISPGIAVTADGPRLQLNAAYTLQALIYARQPDRSYHQLAASGQAVLLEDWLFADASAYISRQNISAFGPQAVDAAQRSDNQSSVGSDSISPYLLHRFKGWATVELRYRRDAVRSDGDLLSVKTDETLLKFSGDNPARNWNWNASYDSRVIDDSALTPVRMRTASLSLNYSLSSKLGLFTSIGDEKSDYAASTPEQPQGRFWSVGMGWHPSSRSSIVVSGGKRFFGNTYSLAASHLSRHTTWSLNYGEDITTTQAQLTKLSRGETAGFLDQLWSASIPDPAARQQQVASFLLLAQLLGPDAGTVNYFSHQFFLQKQASLAMAWAGAKSALSLSVSSTQRTAQTNSGIDNILLGPGQLALQDKTRQNGANAGWTTRLSSRSSLNLGAAYSAITSLSTGREDRNLAFSAGLSRTLRPKLSGAIDLRHVRHSSTDANGAYRENAVAATLNLQF
ncbi:MAG TPA: TIGR03016 family PEP-CTERM system-associated outer membrane protein, partial [Janthinobacterium sp.]|nr:TIGR03016 family PEP-CTERM system-associated outer membrane protein [Janthinobacterium sp.]